MKKLIILARFSIIFLVFFLLILTMKYDSLTNIYEDFELFPTLIFGSSILIVSVFTSELKKISLIINFFFIVNGLHMLGVTSISDLVFMRVTIFVSTFAFLFIFIKYKLYLSLLKKNMTFH